MLKPVHHTQVPRDNWIYIQIATSQQTQTDDKSCLICKYDTTSIIMWILKQMFLLKTNCFWILQTYYISVCYSYFYTQLYSFKINKLYTYKYTHKLYL